MLTAEIPRNLQVTIGFSLDNTCETSSGTIKSRNRPEDGERILKVTKKSGNRGRCRKLCLWKWKWNTTYKSDIFPTALDSQSISILFLDYERKTTWKQDEMYRKQSWNGIDLAFDQRMIDREEDQEMNAKMKCSSENYLWTVLETWD